MAKTPEIPKKDKFTVDEYRRLFNLKERKKRRAEKPPLMRSCSFDDNRIFIAGEVYSSKNSHTIHYRKACKGEITFWRFKGVPVIPFISSNKNVQEYKKNKLGQYLDQRDKFITASKNKPKPLRVEFVFYRKSKGRFDYTNLSQIVQDMMVKAGWIEDDRSDFLIPVFNQYFIDNSMPGVEIIVH